jgi:predicted nucleic acid-binding protein
VGSIELPPVDTVYLDASILIYTIETHAQYWPYLQSFWETAKVRSLKLISSELSILECLVAPLRKNDRLLIQAYRQIFNSADLQLVPLGRQVLWSAAKLRAENSWLRTPDAIHGATSMASNCGVFFTNDVALKKIHGLEVLVLSEFVQS